MTRDPIWSVFFNCGSEMQRNHLFSGFGGSTSGQKPLSPRQSTCRWLFPIKQLCRGQEQANIYTSGQHGSAKCSFYSGCCLVLSAPDSAPEPLLTVVMHPEALLILPMRATRIYYCYLYLADLSICAVTHDKDFERQQQPSWNDMRAAFAAVQLT